MNSQRFAYTPHSQFPVGMPFVDLRLFHEGTNITVSAIVDSGAALNVLPYDVGLSLNPVKLAFAWINKASTEIRVLLGQVNFFQEFDVHFYGHQAVFDIARKTGSRR